MLENKFVIECKNMVQYWYSNMAYGYSGRLHSEMSKEGDRSDCKFETSKSESSR